MKREPVEQVRYERLPARGFGVIHAGTMWLGPDHVLLVHTFPGGEAYRRMFFRDIEAVLVRPTRRRVWINLVLLGLAGLSLLPFVGLAAASGRADGPEAVFFGLGSLFWLALAAANSARGSTCEVRIQTAVQNEPVLALHRERAARRVLARLRPLILAAQAGTPEPPASPTAPVL